MRITRLNRPYHRTKQADVRAAYDEVEGQIKFKILQIHRSHHERAGVGAASAAWLAHDVMDHH